MTQTVSTPYIWSEDNNNVVEAARQIADLSPPRCDTPSVTEGIESSGTTEGTEGTRIQVTPAPKTRERRQIERKIVYPYFSDYIKCTEDPYWQQVFDSCSRAKFPRGSSYDRTNKTICIRSAKTPIFYKIYTADIMSNDIDHENELLYNSFKDIKNFFQTNLNMRSSEDQRQMNIVHDKLKVVSEEKYSNTWGGINLKKVKNAIIRNYLIVKGNALGMTKDKMIESYRNIKIGILFGWIDSSHIVYENGQITDITSLKYNPNTKMFVIDDVAESTTNLKYKHKINRMDELWK
jgi:hypothetical protein